MGKAKATEPWCVDEKGYNRVWAMGDGPPQAWPIPFIPKISYPGEEEGVVACRNLESTDALLFGEKVSCWGSPVRMQNMHWPWGAGMFATSLGPHDACFVVAANWTPKSGKMVLWGLASAIQKELIETTKVDECRMGWIGLLGWHFVHHTPVHLFGEGAFWKFK